MLTSKQRAYLRGLANPLTPIFQVGKEGLSENLIKGIGEALAKQELIKVTLLETAEAPVKEAAHETAKALRAEVVQCIGRKFVLYKRAKKPQIELPR